MQLKVLNTIAMELMTGEQPISHLHINCEGTCPAIRPERFLVMDLHLKILLSESKSSDNESTQTIQLQLFHYLQRSHTFLFESLVFALSY